MGTRGSFPRGKAAMA